MATPDPIPRRRRKSGLPNIMDVAAAAGVSHQTVSRVLNGSELVRDETRVRVEQTIAELGYRRNQAARALASLRSGRIGFIAAHLEQRGPAMLSVAMQEAARADGLETVSVALSGLDREALTDAVHWLLDQTVESIVVAVTHREALATIRDLAVGVPLVLVAGEREEHPFTTGIDNEEGARLATDHLLEAGHRSVALVSGPLDWIEAQQREAGWRAAHQARGVKPGPVWFGDWTPRSGYEAGKLVATQDSLTAAFVSNDQMALGFLLALSEGGCRVPEDVSIVGFDDLPEAAYFNPPLTTIHQDFSAVARRAVDLAMGAISGEPPGPTELVEPRLVLRRSTGAPGA